MKGFFKNIANSMYQKIAQQQHLAPLSTQQIYAVLHRIQSRKKSFHQTNDSSNLNKANQDVWKAIDRFATITPEKEFWILGKQPKFQTIKFRIKQLNDNLQQIENVMVQSYQQYKCKIDKTLKQVQCKKSLSKGKKRSKQLKQKLILIQKVTKLTQKISQKNIKIKNLKDTLQYLKMMPNLKKMNLIQLKMLRIQPKIVNLLCVKHTGRYIEKQISNQIRYVIENLKDLIMNFNNNQYENALRIFILTQQSDIKYEKLLLKIMQNQIRNRENLDLEQTLSFYIKIIINTHKVFSFHRDIANDSSNYLCKQSISINQQQTQHKIMQIIDQTLAYYCSGIMIVSTMPDIYKMLYLVNRFLQIGYSYCRYIFKQTIKQIKLFLTRKIKSTSQKYINQLIENLSMQNNSQWSRMPIPNDFRHQGIDRNLCLFKKYQQSQIYQQIQKSQLKYLNQKVQEDPSQQTWQIKQIEIPTGDKIQKYRDLIKMNFNKQVVLSQSGLNMLRQYQTLSQMLFFYPLISQQTVIVMIAHIQFYLFYLYSHFLSEPLKNFFEANFDLLQERYLQKRIKFKYPNLFKFIKFFSSKTMKQYNSIKPSFKQIKKQERIIIKSRVLSLQSANFILSYLNHIIYISTNSQIQKIAKIRLQLLQLTIKDLTDILYIDCIPRICNIQTITQLIKKIRWDDSNHFYSYLPTFLTVMKDFYNKIKGLGQGQISSNSINVFFSVYWKTMLNFMINSFVKQCKHGKIYKSVFQLFLDQLFKRILQQIFNNQKQNEQLLRQSYRKAKKIVSILYQSQWQSCFCLIKKSLEQYEYILKVTLNIMYASQCSYGISPKQLKQREDSILRWIQQNLLK